MIRVSHASELKCWNGIGLNLVGRFSKIYQKLKKNKLKKNIYIEDKASCLLMTCMLEVQAFPTYKSTNSPVLLNPSSNVSKFAPTSFISKLLKS